MQQQAAVKTKLKNKDLQNKRAWRKSYIIYVGRELGSGESKST
jgi:hypothetical protein